MGMKRGIYLFLLSLILLIIAGCTIDNTSDIKTVKASSTAKSTLLLFKNVEDEYGDLYIKVMGQAEEKVASNVLINNAYLNHSTDTVYFIDNEKNLYKFNRGKDKEKIASDVEQYNMDFENVFYTNSNSDLFVVHVSMETEKIGNEIDQYHLVGSDLIYVNKDDSLKKYNIKEKTEATLASDVNQFKVLSSKNELIYTNEDGISYYIKDSNEAIKLAGDYIDYTDIATTKDAIYFISDSEDGNLHRVPLSINGTAVKIASNIYLFKLYDGLIYYISDDNNLFVKSEKNSDAKKLASDVTNFIIQDDFIYFESSEGVYKIALNDTNNKEKIAELDSSYSITESNKIIQASNEQALYVDDVKLTNDLNSFSILEDTLVYSTNEYKLYRSSKFGTPTVVEEDISDYDYIFYNNNNVYSNTLNISDFVGYWEFYTNHDMVHLEIINNENIRILSNNEFDNYSIKELGGNLDELEILLDEDGSSEEYVTLKKINPDSFVWRDDDGDEYEFIRVTKEQAMSYY